MSSKTKIVVLKSKELIYTGIFIILGIMLILLLFYMFSPGKDKAKDKTPNAKNNIQSNQENNTDIISDSVTESQYQTIEANEQAGITNSSKDNTPANVDENTATDQTTVSDDSAVLNQVAASNDSEATDQVAVSNITDTNEDYSKSAEAFSGYIPGSYSSQLNLGGSTILLTVTVDENKVTGVSMDNMDETLTAMYPLVQPSIDEINSQIGLVASIEDITYSADNKYTTILILDAIDEALEDAKR